MSFYLTFKQLHGLSIDLVLPEIGQVESCIAITNAFQTTTFTASIPFWLAYADHIEQLFIQDTHQVFDLNFFPKARTSSVFQRLKIFDLSIWPRSCDGVIFLSKHLCGSRLKLKL